MKKKMSNHLYRSIIVPVLSVLLALAIGATVVMEDYSDALDTYFGKGESYIETSSDTAELDGIYYEVLHDTQDKAQAAAAAVAERIADEGIVLLKNNNGTLPLEEGSEVTPFGSNFIEFYAGGYGDADPLPSYYVTPETGLSANFRLNQDVVDTMKASEALTLAEAEGTSEASPGMKLGANRMFSTTIFEYDPAIYAGLENSCAGTTGIVFIGRNGNEGHDLKWDAYEDGTPHYLAISEREKQTIAFAKKNCDQVIVVINSSNIVELGCLMEGEYEADAIVWMGLAGATGYSALSDVLCGKVNPSGRTADLYPADLTQDPSYQNLGEYLYENSTVVDPDSHEYVQRSFIEYEEGIYVGYRYYETAAELGSIVYDEAVVFPFGYGLSYTTFEQELVSVEDGDTIQVTVRVTNTGTVAGKEVVQVYMTSPYTDYDMANGIEKASATLAAFDKTDELAPNESQELVLTFDREEMASYDDSRDNGDGTMGCYLLEAGDYIISLRANSHDVIDEDTITVDTTVAYDNSNPRQSEIKAQSELDADGNAVIDENTEYVAATNQFQEATDFMENSGKVTNLSRSDWENTFPTAPAADDFIATEEQLKGFADFDYATDETLGNVEGSYVYSDEEPLSNQNNGIAASELRGKSYDDPLWEKFLDQINYDSDQLDTLLYAGNYITAEVDELSLPATVDLDGPIALVQSFQRNTFCVYPSEVVIASTWNTDLAKEMGQAVGQECLTAGIQGWYAPAMNTHRTPFCGRNFEYYSEDALLSGAMGAAVVSGAADCGIVTYIKHFAMNELETHRQYVSTWATEQTIREIYLKPFEYCIKNAATTLNYYNDENELVTKEMRASTAIMTAQNYIGTKQCSQHYGLLTGVVRNEWGYNGLIETDMYNSTLQWQRDLMLRSGCDMWMVGTVVTAKDTSSATIKNVIREAVHHISYTVVNSSAMQGLAPGAKISYRMSSWEKVLLLCDAAAAVLIALGIIAMVRRTDAEKKNPELYGVVTDTVGVDSITLSNITVSRRGKVLQSIGCAAAGISGVLYLASKWSVYAGMTTSVGTVTITLVTLVVGILLHLASIVTKNRWLRYLPFVFYVTALIMVIDFEMMWIANVLMGIDKNTFDPVWLAAGVFLLIAVVVQTAGIIVENGDKLKRS